jgi:prepilin-type processing-associated H-X9-DG protein
LPPQRRLSWVVELWDVQSSGTALNVDRSKGWDEPPNRSPKRVYTENEKRVNTENAIFAGDPEAICNWVTCPDDPGFRGPKKPFPLTYIGVAGVGTDAPTLPVRHRRAGIFGNDRVTRFEDIRDGMSTTMVVIETARDHGPWTAGGPSSVRVVDPATRPYIGRNRPFGGYHPGGANAAFADGSVRFIRETIDPRIVEAIATIAGGEELPPDWPP